MQRLIDANAFMERLERKKCEPAKIRYTDGFNDAIMKVRSMVHGAPTVNAIPVPCNVGEEIFYVPPWSKKVFKGICHCISISKSGILVHLYDFDGDNATYPASRIFRTKEEAERKCLTGEDNGNAVQDVLLPC